MSTQGVRVINYTVLGQVTACRGSWTANLSPQQQLLLAILVMAQGAPVSRAGLARALWDEEDSPEGGLKRVVSELRTQLRAALPDGDPLPARGDTYCLPLSEQQADVLRFRSKIDQAVRATGRDATRLMQEALREWGGEAPPACSAANRSLACGDAGRTVTGKSCALSTVMSVFAA